jgi:hypothetical protein
MAEAIAALTEQVRIRGLGNSMPGLLDETDALVREAGDDPLGRFHAVRRTLLLARHARTGEIDVTEAAYGASFHQLGRLAVEYRELFGERPMDTSRRRVLG